MSRGGPRRDSTARRAVFAGLIGICLLPLVAASAQGRSGHRRAPIIAFDPKIGHRLPANPILRRGERVILTAPGFARRAKVVVAVVGYRRLATIRANRNGVAVYVFTLPRGLGRGSYKLIFSGAGRSHRRGPPPPRRHRPRHGFALVRVTVPYHPTWRFRVVAIRIPRPHPVPTPHNRWQAAAGGDPAQTGADLLAPLIIGTVLLLAGSLLVAAGRGRRATLGL